MNNYKGKSYDEWVSLILDELNKLKNLVKAGANSYEVTSRAIPFASRKYKATNVHDALEEARGLLLANLDLLAQRYKGGTLRTLLEGLEGLSMYSFNEEVLKLIDSDEQVNSLPAAMDMLLKLVARQHYQIAVLEGELEDIKYKLEELSE